ncbi:hypothetical protein C8J57DRAFT_1477653 [Mycena rebaudengoi]|nr:hypothetical protein C8J57DRAFT_1477653 [Mycena rebaudengoi]
MFTGAPMSLNLGQQVIDCVGEKGKRISGVDTGAVSAAEGMPGEGPKGIWKTSQSSSRVGGWDSTVDICMRSIHSAEQRCVPRKELPTIGGCRGSNVGLVKLPGAIMRAKFAPASAARKRRRRLFFALALVTNTHRTCAHPEHRPCAARQCRRVGAGIGTPMHSRHGRGLGNVYVPAFADASIAPRVFRCSTCGPHFCFTLAAEGFVMHVVRGRRLDCVEGSGGRVSEQCARSVAWAGGSRGRAYSDVAHRQNRRRKELAGGNGISRRRPLGRGSRVGMGMSRARGKGRGRTVMADLFTRPNSSKAERRGQWQERKALFDIV